MPTEKHEEETMSSSHHCRRFTHFFYASLDAVQKKEGRIYSQVSETGYSTTKLLEKQARIPLVVFWSFDGERKM
jgi:hypothetical protein